MTKNTPLIINGQTINPGEQRTIMLPMPSLYDWTPLSMPVHIFHGQQPGPVLCVLATIHGDEVNGAEVIRRLLKKSALKKLTGTLIAIPIVNVYGFLNQERYLMDRRDLNRSFPGSGKGSLASRLAHLLITEIISKATHIIDLHTGSLHRSNLPQLRTDIDCQVTKELATAFNVPVVLHSKLRDGSLREYASEHDIPFLLYEAGESLRFDEMSIRTGVNGILNVMQTLHMLRIKKTVTKKFTPAFVRSSYWLRATHSGFLHCYKTLGKAVDKGELLAKIGNPTGTEEQELRSPSAGIIIGRNNLPMVHEGAALFHIASFDEVAMVAEHIEYLHDSHSY